MPKTKTEMDSPSPQEGENQDSGGVGRELRSLVCLPVHSHGLAINPTAKVTSNKVGSLTANSTNPAQRTAISTAVVSSRSSFENQEIPSTEVNHPPAKRRRTSGDFREESKEKEPETRRVVMLRPLGRDTLGDSVLMKHSRSSPSDPNQIESSAQLPIFIREDNCPILIRMFYSTNSRLHTLATFSKGSLPENEIQMNTWLDATLYELAQELREHCPMSRRRGARIVFTSVSPDERSTVGAYKRRQLGIVITGSGPAVIKDADELDHNLLEQSSGVSHDTLNGTSSLGATQEATTALSKLEEKALPADAGLRDWKPPLDDAGVTLLGKGFQIGDYIDVAISEPTPNTLGGLSNVDSRGPSRRLAAAALANLGAGPNFASGNRMESRLGHIPVGGSNLSNPVQLGGPPLGRVRGVY